ncbi:MAG: hypothetical protein ACTSRK_09910 [Promethearchaeota archaeon]
MEKKDIWLVFGGGKFGTRVLKTFQGKAQIIIIDQDPLCEVARQLSTEDLHISHPNSSDPSPKIELLLGIINNTHNSLFFEGGLPLVVSLWKTLNPVYLIPMVPIHVMKEFLQIMILEKYPGISVRTGIIPTFIDPPTELNIISPDEHTKYLSYAKFSETCPDNCLGKPGYCHYHKRNKPITVTKFVIENLSKKNHYNFESIQLAAGIGGIPSEQIQHEFAKLQSRLEDESSHNSWTCIISTTCNCHGVASAIRLNRKDISKNTNHH